MFGLKRLIEDRNGGTAVYVAFVMAILMGATALTIDGGRLFTLNTKLQDAADAAAMAGAAELDGSLGAMNRATLAARSGLLGTLRNYQPFATDGDGAQVDVDPDANAIMFLRSLPPDTSQITASDVATSDADARFIRVVAETRRVDNALSRFLIGLVPWTTNAVAIAGFTQAVCRVPPLFMCNPFESTDFPTSDPSCVTGTGAPFEPSCLAHGTQILMKTAGSGAAHVPGDFGLLQPVSGNNGAMNVAEQLATTRPNGCFSSSANLRTGEAMGPVRAAFNVRFDDYNNPGFTPKKNDPDFRPALNVTRGNVGSDCNSVPATDPNIARGLPKDDCFLTATCPGGNKFGSGNWDRTGYWNVNHPGVAQPPGYGSMSRHEVYRYEIENPGMIPDNSGLTPEGEDGHPQCYGGGTYSDPTVDGDDTGADEIDRRVIVMAIINCQASGPITGSSGGPYPVERFVRVFLTQPAEGSGNDQADLYGEIVGVLDPGKQNGAVHDLVQLYR